MGGCETHVLGTFSHVLMPLIGVDSLWGCPAILYPLGTQCMRAPGAADTLLEVAACDHSAVTHTSRGGDEKKYFLVGICDGSFPCVWERVCNDAGR